jgi:hypothetical protein
MLFKELSELLRLLAWPGKVAIAHLRALDFQEHKILSGAYSPITLEKMGLEPWDLKRRCDLFGKNRSYSPGSTPGCSSTSCRPNTFGMTKPFPLSTNHLGLC